MNPHGFAQKRPWTGGAQLWFIDDIAPYGHALKMAEDLRRNVFPDQVGFAPDLEATDGPRRVRRFFGIRSEGAGAADGAEAFIARNAR